MAQVALAAPNEAAAAAGERVALAGGNAVDAALAATLVTMVNEVGLVSLSSGGFVTVQPPDATPYTVDGWMDMPGRGSRPPGGGTWDVVTEYGDGVTTTIGPGSVAVHGSVAAFGEVHARDGRLPWRDLVAPAIEVARGGFRLSRASRYYLDHVHLDIYGWDEGSRAALHDRDGELTRGPVVLPDLVTTLHQLADEGPAALHTGDLARRIAGDVLARGGLLHADDLAAYAPVVRPSLATRIGRWTLATTPPPSVGGVCVAAMLRLLEDRPHGPWTPDDLDHLVRVQRAVLGHRLDVLDHTDDVAAAAAAFLALVDRDHLAVLESGSTAHVSAADSDGLACSVTVSSGYGSGLLAEGTGIWLNNCLGEQELNPRGLHGSAPGTRLLSNMAPTVGRHDDGSVLAIGSPGADRITTAVTQVLALFVSGGLSLRDAIDHPRLHLHRAGRPHEQLKQEGEPTMYFGGVGAALVGPDGRLDAAADPRREGAVRLVAGPG
ncbi:gamma-glutamyltransferase [Nocardioides sp. cx-173]|uniref:gamma-glutamyltransferase n=1 Tax=Nocardioides sp. cx-173 TaxID=2898796 RepID=UPI001E47C2EC|nr:gamma-glutamyltransferase [Nocardioides sp. cx-173]MCD4526739.1 gamma-glutamyltransferase family protein [Nocardioides sp. cx-173]UGB42519.1 gamma-glutamyltransferase family protein [Nocardioides sp. cx-173]